MSLTSCIVRPSPSDPSELKDIFIGPYQGYFYFLLFGCATQHAVSYFPTQELNPPSLQWKLGLNHL